MNNNSGIYSKYTKDQLIKKIEELELKADSHNAMFNNSTEGVIAIDHNGKISRMNKVAENLTGWDSNMAIGIEFCNVVSVNFPENNITLHSVFDKILKNNDKSVIEYNTVLKSKIGDEYNVLFKLLPVTNLLNDVIGLIILLKDETEKLKIERNVREIEQRFNSLIDEMNYGLALHEIVQDENGKVIDYIFLKINNAYEKQTGLKREEIIGKRVLEVLPKLESYWIEKFGHVALTGESLSYENYVSDFDKYFEVIAYRPQKNQFIVIANDITSRKIFNKKLINSESKIKSIINTAPVGIGMFVDHKITEANDCLCEIVKYKFDEIIGLDFGCLFVSNDFSHQIELNENLHLNGGKNQSIETQCVRKDGKIITVLLSISLIINENVHIGTTFTIIDITERKEQEIKLRKSEHKYRELIDFAVGGILIGSHDGCIIDANNLACKLLNMSYGQIVGKNISDNIFTIESLKKSPFRYDLLNMGNTVVNQREIRVSKDKIITVETHTKQMPDKTYQMILHDITERKKNENELVKSELKFLTAFKENPIPTLLTTQDEGVILDINDVCEEFTGWKRSEVIGKTTTSIKLWIDEKDRSIVFEDLKKYGRVKNKKIEVYNKYKEVLTVLFSAVHILIDDKKCILTSALDITAITKIQKELDFSEKKYGFLVENINDLVISTDAKGNLLFVSESFCSVFGKRKNEIIDKPLIQFVQKEEIEKVKFAFDELKDDPNKSYFEIHINTKKGVKCFAWSNKAIINNRGDVENVICIGRDITEHKEIEARLLNAKELAEESSRLKSSFLSNMSHEIRTPMNAIMGFAELLKNPAIDLEKRNEFVDIVMSSSKQLLSIIDDIIEISRIDSGLMKINKTPFYLSSFFLNIQTTLNLLVPQNKNIKIISHDYVINNNLLFYTDEVKLKQVFTNLITNAIKYTHSGYIEYGYSFETKDFITFYVKDTGIGINSKFHKTIFERFRQITNEFSWKQSGSGLGLAISKAYVELLGGKIWLESEVGRGSIFYFSVPIETNNGNQLIGFEEKKMDYFELKEGSILIVEDNEMNFEYLNNLFKEINVPAIYAKNGLEAIECCRKYNDIKIVLMDIKMPIMDGFEASKEILKIKPNLPIIAQTAYTSVEDKENALEIGCKAFISKPIRKKELFKALSDVLKTNEN